MKADPRQTETWKGMSLSEKYGLLAATVRHARQLKRVGIMLRKPGATPLETEKELARI
jgi:hypothetical protein